MTVQRRIKEQSAETLVMLMTAFSSVEKAVETMKLGAFHYATKPFDLEEIVLLVAKALEMTRLRREVRALRGEHRREYGFDSLIGASPAMQQVRALLARVAASPASTVLLTGETGTGKALAAKAIHYNSDRAGRALVNITCSALPEELLESDGALNVDESSRIEHIVSTSRLFKGASRTGGAGAVERAVALLQEHGLDAVLLAAADALPPELRAPAFAVAVDLVLSDGRIDVREKNYVDALQAALGVDDATALKIVEVMIIKNRA